MFIASLFAMSTNHKVVKCPWKQKEYIVAYPHSGSLQGNDDEIKETSPTT